MKRSSLRFHSFARYEGRNVIRLANRRDQIQEVVLSISELRNLALVTVSALAQEMDRFRNPTLDSHRTPEGSDG